MLERAKHGVGIRQRLAVEIGHVDLVTIGIKLGCLVKRAVLIYRVPFRAAKSRLQ